MPVVPRLRRRSFWFSTIAVWVVFYLVRALLGAADAGPVGAVWAAIALFIVATLAVARLHDRGRSGWWLAAVLIPVAGALWLLCELAFRGGTAADNAWGADPRQD
jgi:uncharacterized membrane protein YhaH (DUF805 family)